MDAVEKLGHPENPFLFYQNMLEQILNSIIPHDFFPNVYSALQH